MTEQITWTQVTVKLGDLQPWGQNPRTSTKKQAKRLLESWDEFGQVHTVAVGPGLEVYDGHQRLGALLTLHGPGYTVDARQSSRALSEDERKRLVVTLHSGAVGSWDWDLLSGWDAGDLIEWGLDDATLGDWRRDVAALGAMVGSEQPDIDLSQFFEQVTEEYEAKQGFDRIILEYTSDDATAVKQAFAELEGTPEQIVWELLGL